MFVKGSNQYLISDAKAKKLFTVDANFTSKRNWRRKCIHNDIIYYPRNGGTHIKYSGIRDLVYVVESLTNMIIFGAKTRKRLRTVRELGFWGPGYVREGEIQDIKCLASRALVVLLHRQGSIKLMDTGLNVIQRLGPIDLSKIVALGMDSFDVCEEVPGDKTSPLLLFATANDYHKRDRAFFAKIVVKIPYKGDVVLHGDEYKKRHFYVNFKHKEPKGSSIEELEGLIKAMSDELKTMKKNGVDPNSADFKRRKKKMSKLKASKEKRLRKQEDAKMHFLFKSSLKGPFRLNHFDTIGTVPFKGYQNYNLMATVKFCGFLNPIGHQYPVFVGSEWGGDAGLLFYVVNQENRIFCPHPRVTSLNKGMGVSSCLVGAWDNEADGNARKVFYIVDGSLSIRRFEINDKVRAQLLQKVRETDLKDFEGLENI